MSRREDIDNGIWADPDFDALSCDASLLYIWCFTNPRCGMAGIYKVARRQLLEGKLPLDRLDSALAELEKRRFVFFVDGILWVRTRAKFLRTKGEMMKRSISSDLASLPPTHPLVCAFAQEYDGSWISEVVEGFGRGSIGVPESLLEEPKIGTPRQPLEGLQGNGNGMGTVVALERSNGKNSRDGGSGGKDDRQQEWEKWLEHYREVTGRTSVRGSKPAFKEFNARREEGRSLDDLKQATIGCHGNEHCRTEGYDFPETILRPSKIDRYIGLSYRPATGASGGSSNDAARRERNERRRRGEAL